MSRRSWAPRAAMVVGALWLLLATAAGAQLPTPTPPATQPPAVPTIYTGDKPPIGLSGGADSIDALIAQFLAAVKAGDSAALHRLRVTENEYDNIIVPGEVPKGQPPRQTFERVNKVYFGMLDTRSRYTAESIIQQFKGKEFVSHKLELSKGTREFAWFTGHGEVRLTLTDAAGKDWHLLTGWITEVDGRYKFIGFNWND